MYYHRRICQLASCGRLLRCRLSFPFNYPLAYSTFTQSAENDNLVQSSTGNTPSSFDANNPESLSSISGILTEKIHGSIETSSPATQKGPIVPKPLQPYPSDTRFFRYSDQRTSSNKPVVLQYANTVGSANWLASQIKGTVLGMDLEWRPYGDINVSLVQICDENTILLIHLTAMKEFPQTLKMLLEDPKRIKCGVNVKNDASRLATAYSVIPSGLLELGHFAQAIDHHRWSSVGIDRKIISLEKLAMMYLPKPIKKGMGGSTPWDHTYLTAGAKLYAANDCYAGWKIFQILETMRQNISGVEMPDLINYEDDMKSKGMNERRRSKRQLVISLHYARREMNRCLNILREFELEARKNKKSKKL